MRSLGRLHFGPNGPAFGALNCRGNKRHAFHTVLNGGEFKSFRHRLAVDLRPDRPGRFPVYVRKRFNEGFGVAGWQAREALRPRRLSTRSRVERPAGAHPGI